MVGANLAEDNLQIQPTKLKVWIPNGTPAAAAWEPRRVATLACLGDHLRIAGETDASPIS